MKSTWMPTAAGILCITAGGLIGVIPVIVVAVNLVELMRPSPMDGYGVFLAFLFFGPLIILGIVAIVGGIYALRRKNWGLALAGSICALPAGLILGILAIIFIVRGKGEFKAKAPVSALYREESADAYYNRGLAYYEKGEVPEAVNDLEKCIGLSTDPELTKAAQQALRKAKKSL